MEYVFHIIELFAFILPALPQYLSTRLFILTIYFILHSMGANYLYKSYKNQCIKKHEKDENDVK